MFSSLDFSKHRAAVWYSQSKKLRPVTEYDNIQLNQLYGIDTQKQKLITNTENFINHKNAEHVLLRGSRGCGKSSLVKAIFNHYADSDLRLVQFSNREILMLPEFCYFIRKLKYKFIIYCDDFTLQLEDENYIALKTLLEGGIEPPPNNAVLYVTSNRRNLVSENTSDNEINLLHKHGEIHYNDTIDLQMSLADRFGLWLTFYPTNQNEYLAMLRHLALINKINLDKHREFENEAITFARSRGVTNGRVAKLFLTHFSQKYEIHTNR